MKLFYSPGACSLAPHIVANEAGIDLDLVKVDLAARKTETGGDFLAVNPNGYVPVLVVAEGEEPLTEASVIVQYLADRKPESGLLPKCGDFARYRVQQWLAFIATELHKPFGSFFKPTTPEATREINRELLGRRLAFVDGRLKGRAFLTGDAFTVADAYLWTIVGWSRHIGFELAPFPEVQRFMAAVAARPAVRKTLREEGLA